MLTLTTCQAHNTVPICRALAGYLSRVMSQEVRYLDDLSWQVAYERVAAGTIDIAWICGRPYTQLIDSGAAVSLLAAPVMAGERYDNRPIYFSDVVVRRDSAFTRFEDLRGAAWAYNEPGSQSGYHITRYHLARVAGGGHFFGSVIGSGAHVKSLQMVLEGEVDASAIDSTVLEWELTSDPALGDRLRVIEVLGPSPIPPLVVASSEGLALLPGLREALLNLDATDEGRAVLAMGRLSRFAAVTDGDYDTIRLMDEMSAGVDLTDLREAGY